MSETDKRDLYQEEVELLVDGLVEDILGGHVASQEEADERLMDAIRESSYATDEELCRVALCWSKYPTYYFFHFNVVDGEHKARQAAERFTGTWAGVPWDAGRAAFPWAMFAYWALYGEAAEELAARPEFAALPRSAAADAGEEDTADGEGEEV